MMESKEVEEFIRTITQSYCRFNKQFKEELIAATIRKTENDNIRNICIRAINTLYTK